MPAVSPSQQRLFGMVDAYQKGSLTHPPSAEVKRLAGSMTHKQVHDFAATRGLADGGHVDTEDRLIETALHTARRKFQMGGVTPQMPYFERQEARNIAYGGGPYGYEAGFGSGRFDKNNVSVGASSYVIPADILAGLGEGNSLAGAKAFDQILHSMPYGIQPPRMEGHRGPPRPPSDPELARGMFEGDQRAPIGPQIADGGDAGDKGAGEPVPIVRADGEYTVSPYDVERIGAFYWNPKKKDPSHQQLLRHGHAILDQFCKEVRGRMIKKLKSLPGPVGSDNPKVGHVKQ